MRERERPLFQWNRALTSSTLVKTIHVLQQKQLKETKLVGILNGKQTNVIGRKIKHISVQLELLGY
jgi:hypothetical protein